MYDCLIEFYKSTNSNLFLLTCLDLIKLLCRFFQELAYFLLPIYTLTKINKNT